MTEEYMKRKLPVLYPVIMKKISTEKHIEMLDTCNDLCIANYTEKAMNREEQACLCKCFNKVLEMDKFIEEESYRLFVLDVKEFLRKDGV